MHLLKILVNTITYPKFSGCCFYCLVFPDLSCFSWSRPFWLRCSPRRHWILRENCIQPQSLDLAFTLKITCSLFHAQLRARHQHWGRRDWFPSFLPHNALLLQTPPGTRQSISHLALVVVFPVCTGSSAPGAFDRLLTLMLAVPPGHTHGPSRDISGLCVST
jgi:hypothetical protein